MGLRQKDGLPLLAGSSGVVGTRRSPTGQEGPWQQGPACWPGLHCPLLWVPGLSWRGGALGRVGGWRQEGGHGSWLSRLHPPAAVGRGWGPACGQGGPGEGPGIERGRPGSRPRALCPRCHSLPWEHLKGTNSSYTPTSSKGLDFSKLLNIGLAKKSVRVSP